MQSNGTTWTSASLNVGGVTTLVNNVTVGTGTSVTYSGLTLTNYKFLIITLTGVTESATKCSLAITSTGDAAHSLNGTNKFINLYGSYTLDLSTGYLTGITQDYGTGSGVGGLGGAYGTVATGYSTSTTSIVFTMFGGTANFSGGTIGIYGLK